MLYDINRAVTARTAIWPGDAPYQVEMVLRMGEGSPANLTKVSMSPHTGSHADAYFHYEVDGARAARMPLESYIGPALVVSVAKRDGPLLPADLPALPERVERLLIHSHVSDLPDDQWPPAFPYLSIELIDLLAERGCLLIGLDSPSVDAFDSKTLPCHRRLYARGMVNLECLYLRGVPDGLYELIALPLKLDEACASPVRAVLRELPR